MRARYSTGAYHAKAVGYKATVSSTISASEACDRLMKKLYPTAAIERIEAVQDRGPAALNLFRYHLKPVEGA